MKDERRRDQRKGSSIVEFAILAPLLLMMTAGAADFSRMFLESTVMVGGASNAVKYGAQNVITSADTDVMVDIATGTPEDATGTQETADRVCDCPGSPGAWVDCISATCPSGYGKPRAYVRVRMNKSFQPLAAIPGLPESVALDFTEFMRVQ